MLTYPFQFDSFELERSSFNFFSVVLADNFRKTCCEVLSSFSRRNRSSNIGGHMVQHAQAAESIGC